MKWHRLLAVCGLVAATQASLAGAAKNDVDQDGRSDLLLLRVHEDGCDPEEGEPVPTHYNGHVVWGVRVGAPLGFTRLQGFDSLLWRATASGDFNRDGLPDLFWERLDHVHGSSLHEGQRVDTKAAVTPGLPVVYQAPSDSPGMGAPANSWTVVGSSDFVGRDSTTGLLTPPDGRDDLVWFDQASGSMSVWASNDGSFPKGLRFALPPAAPGTTPVAVGDLDADGNPEIVFSDESGVFTYWRMQGTVRLESGEIVPNHAADPNWEIGGAGDFDGDGTEDLVFLNRDSYHVAVWYMEPGQAGKAPTRWTGDATQLIGEGQPIPGNPCDEWTIAGPR